ncbi:MAG TPA: YbgA family protein, partial [Gammaproteobacteria bacterium]|nr:YbgA family protein [Gammaproteobacteria bacterium]
RDPAAYRELGRLVATTRRADLAASRETYIARFMAAMARRPDRGGHVNALTHAMGFLKRSLPAADRRELLALFDAYRQREVPLITPVTLLRHHLRRHGDPYLASQHYLAPCPDGLALRSAI